MERRAIAVFWTLAALSPFAQALDPNREITQYVHRIWQSQQGLPDATVMNVFQSRTGYLWLATEAGLVRFDGVRFTPAERLYPGAPAGAWTRSLFEDPDGTMWLAANDLGVYALSAGKSIHYTPEQGLPDAQTLCVTPGTGGFVWVCTDRGLARIEKSTGKITTFHVADGIANDYVRAACEDRQGRLWVGSDGIELTIRTGDKFTKLELKGLRQEASVRAMLCTENEVWVGTTFGLYRIRGDEQRLFTTRNGLVDDFVFNLAPGEHDTLWIGTRSGFSRYRNGTFDSFRPQAGLSQSTAQAVFEDREGSLWVGTKRGLNQFTNGRSVPYTAAEGLPSNEAGPVLQDSGGIIWAGTLDAGLARFDGRRFVALTTRDGLPSNGGPHAGGGCRSFSMGGHGQRARARAGRARGARLLVCRRPPFE